MISAKKISEFLDENKDASEIVVRINSRGGDVQEGWAIYDLLVNSGKKIKTIGEGKIYSIATIVFLAGSEREIMSNADGLIHNPFIPEYTLADKYESEDLLKIAEGLKQEEEKILDFYAEKTGTGKAKLAEYMKEDTKLSAEDMLSLGFATKIIEPVKAYAFIKPKSNIMTEKDVKTFGQKIDTILEKLKNLSRIDPENMVMKDKDGKEFTVERESGTPAVGDAASPDGSYAMADGKTITVADGKITEIKEPQSDDELEQAKQKITELEGQLADKDSEIETLKSEKTEAETRASDAETSFKEKEKEAQEIITELQNLKNSWKPEGRNKFSSAEKVGNINLKEVKEILDKKKSEKVNQK